MHRRDAQGSGCQEGEGEENGRQFKVARSIHNNSHNNNEALFGEASMMFEADSLLLSYKTNAGGQ